MARGIITVRPNTGSTGTTAGRIIVTDPKSSGSSSSSSSSTSTLSSGSPSYSEGQEVQYTKVTVGNVGDLVDFDFDAVTGEIVISSVTLTGTVIDKPLDDSLIVDAGQVYLVKSRIEQKITVKGGTVALVDGSSVGSKIESITAGSFLFASKTSVEAKVEFTGASTVILKDSKIDGKVMCTGSLYAAVCNCNIGGNLDFSSVTTCKAGGNTVSGSDNTGSCGSC